MGTTPPIHQRLRQVQKVFVELLTKGEDGLET